MQQVIGSHQGQFGRLTDIIGRSYRLHTPEALRDALRHGTQTVHRPYFAGPFYLCLPINTQPKTITALNIEALPERLSVSATAPVYPHAYDDAAKVIKAATKIVIKAGGGARKSATTRLSTQ